MLKKLLLAALWLPLMAHAQSYPSPTYNNVTVLGTLTGKVNSTGSTITNATITGGTISGLSSPLPVASGGTNSASASGTALDNITGFAGTGFMSRAGAGAYSFTASTGSGSVVLGTSPSIATPTITGSFTATGLVTTTDLATQAANTVLANATGSSASPTAFAMPSCSAATNALTWTTSTGFTCNSAINAATLGGATFAAPGPIGSTSANTGSFTTLNANGTTTITSTSGNSLVVNATGNSNGATVLLEGNGATTPNKYIRAFNGAFQVVNSANSATPMSMDDAGDVTFTGSVGGSYYVSPTLVGASQNPNITNPVTTTATSTINTNTITVTSATGITVGMGIYATFAPGSCSTANAAFVNPYVTAIAGTTVTMSCNATATNGSPVSVQFGQTRFGPASTLLTNNLGSSYLKLGQASAGNSASWLDQISAGQDYQKTSTAQIVTNNGDGYALTIGARSSDATGGAAAFGLQSLLYLDTWGNTAYEPENVYLQDNLASATAGHAQPHIQMEQSINSLWTTVGEDPYSTNVVNQTILHRYDCGTGQGSSPFPNNCTSAMDIVPNGAKLENGLVIANGAIDTTSGTGNGIVMPQNINVIWYSAANTYAASLSSKAAGMLDINNPSGGGIRYDGSLLIGASAPGISSGFGTGPSVTVANGTAAFVVHVGTSPGSSGVLSMPTAANGWMCDAIDASQQNSTQFYLRQTASTTTTVTFTMFSSSGTSSSFVAGDSLVMKCTGY